MNRITATLLCLVLCLAGTSLHATAFAAEQTSVSAPSAPSPATPAQVVALKTPVVPPPLIRPFPAPVTTRTVTVPASIDATGASDVSDALMAFIAGVPDGSLINFPAAGIYRIDHAVEFTGRHNLIFDGNGCTLEYTSVTGTTTGYSFWYDLGGGSDIWIKNFILIGSSPYPGVFTQGTSPTGGEWQHGVIVRSDRFEVSGCTVSAVWGDGFFVGGDFGYVCTPSGVWIHDNHVISAGRNGLTITSGANVIAERNAFDVSGYVTFDIEPNFNTESASNIIFRNNTAETWGTVGVAGGGLFFGVEGTHTGAVIDKIVVDGNTVTGGSLFMNCDNGGTAGTRMTRITFTNNKGTVATGPIFHFAHIDGLTVTGNVQPLTSGVLTRITDCTEAGTL